MKYGARFVLLALAGTSCSPAVSVAVGSIFAVGIVVPTLTPDTICEACSTLIVGKAEVIIATAPSFEIAPTETAFITLISEDTCAPLSEGISVAMPCGIPSCAGISGNCVFASSGIGAWALNASEIFSVETPNSFERSLAYLTS